MMQSPEYSPKVHFGTAFEKHLKRIWNLCISYPTETIWLWDDDVSGAFRHANIIKILQELLPLLSCHICFYRREKPLVQTHHHKSMNR